MPIEFFCPECESELRTPDEMAGLRIRCPVCQEPTWVPHRDELEDYATEFHDADITAGESADEFEELPEFSSPATPLSSKQLEQAAARVTLNEIIATTWKVFIENLPRCIIISLIDTLICVVAMVAMLILCGLLLFAFRGQAGDGVLLMAAAFGLGGLLLYTAISVRNYRQFLAICRGTVGQERAVSSLKTGTISQAAVAALLYWCLVGFGLTFFVLPGLVAMALLWSYLAFIVDRNSSAIESLVQAFRLTRRNIDVSVGVFLIHLLLIGATLSVPILGQFLALPLAAVMHSVAYLYLTGEISSASDVGSVTSSEHAEA